jgi:hypothetical protein
MLRLDIFNPLFFQVLLYGCLGQDCLLSSCFIESESLPLMLAFVYYLTSLLVLFKSFLLLVHHVIGSEDLVLDQATLGRFSLILIFAK